MEQVGGSRFRLLDEDGSLRTLREYQVLFERPHGGLRAVRSCLKDVLSSKHESFAKGQLAYTRMKDLFGK